MYKLSRITIDRMLDDDGDDVISVSARSPGGEDLPMVEALGLLMFGLVDLIAPMILSNIDEVDDE